jgi:hypothetical protein
LNSDSGVENASSTYILGEEVDETLPDNITVKSTAKLNGDSLTVTSKSPSGKVGTRVYKFSDTELVMTLSGDKGPEGKRVYKRI